jgi:N-acetyl-anhydromuramyl-L-alanine amidase AmpD
MEKFIKFGEFKPLGKGKKTQIILTHTSRNLNDYLQSLKYRYNGKYKKIPNYIISKDGKILNLLDNNEYSEYYPISTTNKSSVIISLENLGWLEKEPLKQHYVNWIGDIYNGKVFEKSWREYFFWDPYTDEQIVKLSELCKLISAKINIPLKITGHNTKINGVDKFEGIVSNSNYDSEVTDLNPSFNFDTFLSYL